MKIRRSTGAAEKIEMQMTPMIDIVFQLLVFFIMTFKIVTMEGDFSIKMPSADKAAGAMMEDFVPPLTLELGADSNGNLNRIRFPELDAGNIDQESASTLKTYRTLDDVTLALIPFLGDKHGPGSRRSDTKVTLDVDDDLHYKYVIEAISAVSGHKKGGQTIKLVSQIEFTGEE